MRVSLKAALGASALVLPCALEACTGFYVGRLSALCSTDRVRRGAGVRRFWRARERELAAGWEKAYAEAVALDATDRAAAAKLLTRFSVAAQEAAEADAKRIFDELAWHMAEHSESFDFRSSNEGVLRPADPPKPFAPAATVSPPKTGQRAPDNGIHPL